MCVAMSRSKHFTSLLHQKTLSKDFFTRKVAVKTSYLESREETKNLYVKDNHQPFSYCIIVIYLDISYTCGDKKCLHVLYLQSTKA